MNLDNLAEIDANDESILSDENEIDETENEENEAEREGESAENEIVDVTIGEDSPTSEDKEPAPEWVKDLRRKSREDSRRIKELEAQLNAKQQAPEEKAIELGPKPTLMDFNWDAEEFEKALDSWHEKRDLVEKHRQKLEQQKQVENEKAKKVAELYKQESARFDQDEFADAEFTVENILTEAQQAIIVRGSNNPAALVFALGKSADKLKQLSSIDDPVKFAFEVAAIDRDLKMKKRTVAPSPEKTVKASSSLSSSNNKLEALRAEAERTGDYTKVVAFKRAMKRNS